MALNHLCFDAYDWLGGCELAVFGIQLELLSDGAYDFILE
jgi:hypothetical protein